MDHSLRNALDSLRRNGALRLPDPATIEQAPNGTRWHGKKKNGDPWMLIKHKIVSYNVEV